MLAWDGVKDTDLFGKDAGVNRTAEQASSFLGSGGRSPPARRVVNRLLDRKAIIHLPRVRDPPQDCNVWVPNIRRRSSRVVGSSCDPASGIQPGALWVG